LYNYYHYYHDIYVIKMNERNERPDGVRTCMCDRIDRARHRERDPPGGQVMMGTPDIPPAWSPADHASYPFRSWVRDIRLWAVTSDLPHNQVGAAVIKRLDGAPLNICNKINPIIVMYGGTIDVEGVSVPITGVEFLLRVLLREYVLPAEQNGSASSANPAADLEDDQHETHDPGRQGSRDSRDGAYPDEDYDDFSESATSGDTDMPESLVDYLAEVPAAERGYHLWREYVLARRRWRNFNNRSTRFERRSLRRKGKGKGRGGESKDQRSGNPHGQH
jgi:hypothetical protein